jgi:hypothetical protein
MVLSGDARPAERLAASAAESCTALTAALESWRRLNATDLPAINTDLTRLQMPALTAVTVPSAPACAR